MVPQTTLCLLLKEGKVLLAMKKRGEKLEADFLFGENDEILNYNLKII